MAQRTFDLKVERSPSYRVLFVDGAGMSTVKDDFGERIVVSFSRVDTRVLSEGMITDESGSLTPTGTINAEPVRTVEFDALIRPDHAIGIVRNFALTLQQLPPDRKAFYKAEELISGLSRLFGL